ncbi:MAG: hypothetical protein FWD17_17955 [Polyangiaceae bacterium]|nr:hypothetical protein [Polyangiaceae bacterium]
MNLTAVQLRGPLPSPELAYGDPAAVRSGSRGPVALFVPGSLVAYELGVSRRRRLFVFRTLVADDRLAATVPGVHGRVRLLLHLRTRARIARLRSVFAELLAVGQSPLALSDAFFVRVGAVLEGRRGPQRSLSALLRRETSR